MPINYHPFAFFVFMNSPRIFICLLAFAGTFFLSCKNASPESDKIVTGHEQMVQILDSIARNADPAKCYNLNAKMVSQLEPQVAALSDPSQRAMGMFKLSEQYLYAGQTERATMTLTQLSQMLGNNITENYKPIFEFLALSYLRLGEQQNCIDKHNAESCIIPIQGKGVYDLPSGPENAIRIYEQILEKFPDDLDSRWLLNIAYMNLGKYPDGVPAKYRIPPSAFRAQGNIRFQDVAIPLGVDMKGLAGSVCMDDFDNDGDLDLFTTSYGLNQQARYFENTGKDGFKDKTSEAGIGGIISGLNTIHADFDNDGDRDIFILRGGWLDGGTHPNSLLRNNGNGTFRDVTIEAGLLSFHPTQTAAWADYDGDGWLDLYIANESKRGKTSHPNELFHNNGDGTFTELAAQLNVNLEGFFKAAVWGDINNDQLPDLFLSNLVGPNQLLVNRGGESPETWKFESISEKAGITNPIQSFPAWFFDYNNDGLDDVLVCGYQMDRQGRAIPEFIAEVLGTPSDSDVLRLYKNNGDETFTDVHQTTGLHKVNLAMGCNFGDLDNDGWTDFYLGTGIPDLRGLIPNRMFRNNNGKNFEELTMNGFGHLQKGHGVAFGDVDNDGDQDIYQVMGGAYEGDLANNILFENPGSDGHWISIDLKGNDSNRDAIGARIAVTINTPSGKRTVYARVNTGASFGSASLRQEIGLGNATSIESIEIIWPKPGTEPALFTDIPLDAHIRIEEGLEKVSVLDLKPIQFL